MKNVMGVIYTGEKDSFLRELTLLRAIAAMPVAGRYRVIDFLVSSMVGLSLIHIYTIIPVSELLLEGEYTIDVQGKQHPKAT